MAEIEDGGPAFPLKVMRPDTSGIALPGMSLRDWFAGQAMQVLLEAYAEDRETVPANTAPGKHIAIQAYAIADAMIAARRA